MAAHSGRKTGYPKPTDRQRVASHNKRAAMEPMDEQQARQRLLEGGYFVALGVPPGVEFGIDLKSYEVPGEVLNGLD